MQIEYIFETFDSYYIENHAFESIKTTLTYSLTIIRCNINTKINIKSFLFLSLSLSFSEMEIFGEWN